MEWLIPATSDSDPTMPAAPQQQFNLAVNLSTEMLRALKQNDGLQGPLKAHLYDGTDLVGAASLPRLALSLRATTPLAPAACTECPPQHRCRSTLCTHTLPQCRWRLGPCAKGHTCGCIPSLSCCADGGCYSCGSLRTSIACRTHATSPASPALHPFA